MTTEQAHAIATEVERRLRKELPEIADGMGLAFHDLHVNTEEDGSYSVELHLEMLPELSLREAHALADEFEQRVAEGASRPFRLIAHLEPVPDDVLHPEPDIPQSIRDLIRTLIVSRIGESRLSELQTYRFGPRIAVTASVSIRAGASLAEAHALSEAIERELLNAVPQIHRVTVHVEPEEA
jgi:divalent metal cation (Fe/Co/Zn/Cd) transporter